MNITGFLARLFRKTKPSAPGSDKAPLSMVLLLREFRDLPEEVLALAAERAWNADFHSEDSGNYVVKNEAICLLRKEARRHGAACSGVIESELHRRVPAGHELFDSERNFSP
jgi:hypothetical protein